MTRITRDEFYPYYQTSDSFGNKADVPFGVLAKWRRVIKEFKEVQNEMEMYYRKCDPKTGELKLTVEERESQNGS